MRFMKTCKVFPVIFLVFSLNCAYGQHLAFLFGHGEYASPVGKLREANNSGAGVEAGVGVGIGKTFVVGTVGTTWFAVNKRGTVSQGGLKYTPFKLGVRRYVLLKNLFVKADAGLATIKIIDTDNKSSHLTTSFGAGIKFTGFEALVDYNSVASYGSWVGLKFGFTLGL
jgi:hypothetical protein